MKNLLLATLVCALLTLVGCGGAGPGDRVKEFNHAMADGDIDKVKKIAPIIDTMLSEEKLKQMVDNSVADAKERGGIESISIDEETITGDTAHVKATVTFGDGSTEDGEYDLKKVDGEWIFVIDEEAKDDGPELDLTPDVTPEVNPEPVTP